MTISEAAIKTNLTPDTLRYYEKIGLTPPIPRNKSKIRDYRDTDIQWILFVKCLKKAGLSLEDIIEYINLYMHTPNSEAKRKNILLNKKESILHKIEELNSTLDYLDMKISSYDTKIRKDEHKRLKKD